MTKFVFAIMTGQIAEMPDLHLTAVITLYHAGLDGLTRDLRQRGIDVLSWQVMIQVVAECLDLRQKPFRWA